MISNLMELLDDKTKTSWRGEGEEMEIGENSNLISNMFFIFFYVVI